MLEHQAIWSGRAREHAYEVTLVFPEQCPVAQGNIDERSPAEMVAADEDNVSLEIGGDQDEGAAQEISRRWTDSGVGSRDGGICI